MFLLCVLNKKTSMCAPMLYQNDFKKKEKKFYSMHLKIPILCSTIVQKNKTHVEESASTLMYNNLLKKYNLTLGPH